MDGDSAGKRRTHRDPHQWKHRAQADWEGRYGEGYGAWPPAVRWAYLNRRWISKRFTPWQWALLWVTYRIRDCGCETEMSMRYITQATGMVGRPHKVHKAQVLMYRTLHELYFDWRPANDRWHAREQAKARGEDPPPLSAADSKILAKHRRTKKGRRGVQLYDVPDPVYDAMYKAIRFSDLGPGQREGLGVPDSYTS